MIKSVSSVFLLVCGLASAAVAPPRIESLLKPEVYRRVLREREAVSTARLEEERYSFYAAMAVNVSPAMARETLTDYRLYPKMIPYVQEADFDAPSKTLKIKGGIWKFLLRSTVVFDEVSDRWIRYRIVQGHFAGMTGNIYFEPAPEKGTLVYFDGEQRGKHWPPKFVIERGAEIVFGFTARRMRSYMEEKKGKPHDSSQSSKDAELPQPRSHL